MLISLDQLFRETSPVRKTNVLNAKGVVVSSGKLPVDQLVLLRKSMTFVAMDTLQY